MARLKFDENVADSVCDVLRAAGHDVAIARDELLAGVNDERLLAVAVSERWALVTFDLDFSDVRRHSPTGTSGIIVFRLHDQTLGPIRRAASVLAKLLLDQPLSGRLWILDEQRLRIWPAEDADAGERWRSRLCHEP